MEKAKAGLALGIGTLATLIGGYAGAAIVGGLVPVNAGWRQASTGIPVAIASNGIHVSLILPTRAAGVDWRRLVRDEHLPGAAVTDRLAFGWGDRAFYMATPTWADVRPATVLGAIAGNGPTLVHVDRLTTGMALADERPIRLRPAEYRRLVGFVASSFAIDARRGASPTPGYDKDDVFYAANGRYSAIHTCNVWVGRALAHAGVRVGMWTPLPSGVTRWFRLRD